MFIWTLLHKGLNTGDKCKLRHPNMALFPNWCILCKMNDKSIEHTFVQCSYSTTLWSSLNMAATHQLPISLGEILYVLTNIKQNTKKKVLWSNLIGAQLWCIWLERNNRIFQDKSNRLSRLFENIISLDASWCKKSKLFCNYEISCIAFNWKVFLQPYSCLFILNSGYPLDVLFPLSMNDIFWLRI